MHKKHKGHGHWSDRHYPLGNLSVHGTQIRFGMGRTVYRFAGFKRRNRRFYAIVVNNKTGKRYEVDESKRVHVWRHY